MCYVCDCDLCKHRLDYTVNYFRFLSAMTNVGNSFLMIISI